MDPKYIEIYDLVQASPDEYLMHHQIKGAKWGVHRGPPYPLQSGIRTKIKRVTNAAKERSKENQAKRAARTAAKKQAAAEAKKRKEDVKAEKKETIQDKINKMSDAELIERTNRLRLENAYKRELPKEKEGKTFLQATADLFNRLNTAGQAFNSLVKTGKEFAKLFGLVEDKTKKDTSLERLPGESVQDYSKRLSSLVAINKSKETLGSNKTKTPSKSVNWIEEIPNDPKSATRGFFADKVNSSKFDDWEKEDPDKKKKGG